MNTAKIEDVVEVVIRTRVDRTEAFLYWGMAKSIRRNTSDYNLNKKKLEAWSNVLEPSEWFKQKITELYKLNEELKPNGGSK